MGIEKKYFIIGWARKCGGNHSNSKKLWSLKKLDKSTWVEYSKSIKSFDIKQSLNWKVFSFAYVFHGFEHLYNLFIEDIL